MFLCRWLTAENSTHGKPAIGSSIGRGEVTQGKPGVIVAWFVRRDIAAGKTQHSLRTQQVAIFQFFKMAPARHLALVTCLFKPIAKSIGHICHCIKFGWNRCSSLDKKQVLIFCELGLKMPIHAHASNVSVPRDFDL